MKRPYETMVVFNGALPDDVLQKEQKQFEDLIGQIGEFEKTDVWGKKALAYPINKKRSGYYCLFLFSASGDIVPALDKHIKHNENILRHLTVVRDLKNDIARQNVAMRRERLPENESMSSEHEGGRFRSRDRDRGDRDRE